MDETIPPKIGLALSGGGSRATVRAYHGELQHQNIRPIRNLDDDRQITEEALMSAADRKAA
jgi:hypothetical protein